jgi:hypothetical protein
MAGDFSMDRCEAMMVSFMILAQKAQAERPILAALMADSLSKAESGKY